MNTRRESLPDPTPEFGSGVHHTGELEAAAAEVVVAVTLSAIDDGESFSGSFGVSAFCVVLRRKI